eukprot:2633359-Pleurochrysis_carterae.AAC.1
MRRPEKVIVLADVEAAIDVHDGANSHEFELAVARTQVRCGTHCFSFCSINERCRSAKTTLP